MNEIIAPMVTQTVLNVLPVHLTPLSSRVHFVLFCFLDEDALTRQVTGLGGKGCHVGSNNQEPCLQRPVLAQQVAAGYKRGWLMGFTRALKRHLSCDFL